ncbi:MAG TPA: hypothetical protein VFZ53_33735 [Polyangiaceae bacterium]
MLVRNKKRFSAPSAVVLAGALGLVASEVRAETRVELGMRTGYAVPIGKAAENATLDMNEGIAGQIPLWFDLGARIGERVFVGPYFSYGFGILGESLADDCDEAQSQGEAVGIDVSCSTTDMRLGAQVLYHFGPPNETHLWLGGGIGYEWWRFSQSLESSTAQATLSVTAHGFELLNLQVGGDFPLSEHFALGPFMAFTLAQYGKASGDCSGDCSGVSSSSDSIDDKSLHQWLFFGIRGTGLP